jgi:hypothetical protein
LRAGHSAEVENVVATLIQSFGLQLLGEKLGLAAPREPRPGTALLEANEEPDPVHAPDPLKDAAGAPLVPPAPACPTMVYGFRADVKPVKAPDEVLGRGLNTLA